MKSLKNKVCGGVVAYNPEIDDFRKNVQIIAEQVKELVIIDNHSTNIEEIKEATALLPNVVIIQNDKNYGIARALNQILDYADTHGYEWYLTLDQDSECSKDLVEEYSTICNKYDELAIVCPFILNNNKVSVEEYKSMQLKETDEITDPVACITSASLNAVSAARSVGGYDEKLFIDCVDIDFNIRIIAAGYKILRANKAYMIQSMGKARYVPLIGVLYKMTGINLFKKLRYSPVYNNMRIYYIIRNSCYIYSKYKSFAGKRMSPAWMCGQLIYYSITYPMSISRFEIWKTAIRGYRDAKKIGR